MGLDWPMACRISALLEGGIITYSGAVWVKCVCCVRDVHSDSLVTTARTEIMLQVLIQFVGTSSRYSHKAQLWWWVLQSLSIPAIDQNPSTPESFKATPEYQPHSQLQPNFPLHWAATFLSNGRENWVARPHKSIYTRTGTRLSGLCLRRGTCQDELALRGGATSTLLHLDECTNLHSGCR